MAERTPSEFSPKLSPPAASETLASRVQEASRELREEVDAAKKDSQDLADLSLHARDQIADVQNQGETRAEQKASETADTELKALDAEIAKEQRLVDYDTDTKRSLIKEGDEDKLRELKARRDALIASRERTAAQKVESGPELPSVNTSPEPVLGDFDLDLRDPSEKALDTRFSNIRPEQVTDEALDTILKECNVQVDIITEQIGRLDGPIKELESLNQYDKATARVVTALGNKADLEKLKADRAELRARQKKILARMSAIDAEQERRRNSAATQAAKEVEETAIPGPVPAEEAPPVPITESDRRAPIEAERAEAESRGRVRRMLQAAIRALDRAAEAKKKVAAGLNRWMVVPIMKATSAASEYIKDKWVLEQELKNDRPGFGARFKERAGKAYRAAINHLKGGWDEESTAPAATETQAATEADESGAPSTPEDNPEQAPQPEQIEQRPNHSRARFWWERIKGTLSLGVYDYNQGRRMQWNTRDAAQQVARDARQIEVDKSEGLYASIDAAETFALQVKNQMTAEGKDLSDPRFVELTTQIMERRAMENNTRIDVITLSVITRLEEKLKKYKNVDGEVLTPEAKNRVAEEIRRRLTEMRGSAVEVDAKELSQITRKILDPRWAQHYMYGAGETAAGALLYSGLIYGGWVGYNALFAKAGGVAAKEITSVGLKTTVWAEAKRQLIQNGITNPTNQQIMKATIQICKDSGVKVVTKAGEILWSETAKGMARDRALKQGFPLIVSSIPKLVAGFKAGAAAVGVL